MAKKNFIQRLNVDSDNDENYEESASAPSELLGNYQQPHDSYDTTPHFTVKHPEWYYSSHHFAGPSSSQSVDRQHQYVDEKTSFFRPHHYVATETSSHSVDDGHSNVGYVDGTSLHSDQGAACSSNFESHHLNPYGSNPERTADFSQNVSIKRKNKFIYKDREGNILKLPPHFDLLDHDTHVEDNEWLRESEQSNERYSYGASNNAFPDTISPMDLSQPRHITGQESSTRAPQECRKCYKHGYGRVLLKGHKNECPCKDCDCKECKDHDKFNQANRKQLKKQLKKINTILFDIKKFLTS